MRQTKKSRRVLSGILLCLLAALLVFFSGSTAFAAGGYDTDRFDVDMTVEDNHVIHVKETIQVDFLAARHGIFRYIPYESGIYTIKNIKVDGDPYSTETVSENGAVQKVIQIGDADETIKGKHTYTIRYDIVGYEDETPGQDYLSIDLLPTGWESAISAASIKVSLPKAVDPASLNLYSGYYGMDGNQLHVKADYDEETNVITINTGMLYQGAGITLQADLPEGYWQGAASRDWMVWLLVGILIALPLLMGALWLIFGRDPKVVETVEFYPPEGLTPAEIGYVIDQTIDNKDLASMIMYYADKGWLSIREYTRDQFELTRLSAVSPSEKGFSKTLFNAIFEEGDTVRLDEMPEGFGEMFMAARTQLKSWYTRDRALATTSSKVVRGIGMVLMFVPALAAILISALESFDYFLLFTLVPAMLLLLVGLFLGISVFDRRDVYRKGKKTMLGILSGILGIAGTAVGACVAAMAMEQGLLALLTLASGAVTFVFVMLMDKRTAYGAGLTGKILGFRAFIEAAELEKLEMLVEQDPAYFFNIMPYAYVMGLSDTWAKKFENIRLKTPSYYTGYNGNTVFTALWYSHMFRSCSRGFSDSAVKSFVASTGGDSGGGSIGGGFGGGGFSGGGFGGGGGGSW